MVGAGAIFTSMASSKPIRVFRSSKALQNPYRALTRANGPTQYRYDGLYRVSSVDYVDEEGNKRSERATNASPSVTGRLYQFQFERIGTGSDDSSNQKSFQQLINHSTANGTLAPAAQRRQVRSTRRHVGN